LQDGTLVANLGELDVRAMSVVVYGRFGWVDLEGPS
jgi:hypothetical protein